MTLWQLGFADGSCPKIVDTRNIISFLPSPIGNHNLKRSFHYGRFFAAPAEPLQGMWSEPKSRMGMETVCLGI
jgi:hypothetical protein